MSIATMASSSTTTMGGSAMRRALLAEVDREAGAAAAALDREPPVELRDEAAHELQAERADALGNHVVGQADAVVAHRQAAPAVAAVGELHHDLAAPALGERMLERVEQQLVHDQAARHGRVDAEQHLVVDDGEKDPRRIDGERLEEQVAERADVVAEVDQREVRRLVQLL